MGRRFFWKQGDGHEYTEPQRDARPLLRKKAVRRQRLHVRRELSGAASGSELSAFRAGGQAHGAQPGGVSFLPRFTVERDIARGRLWKLPCPWRRRGRIFSACITGTAKKVRPCAASANFLRKRQLRVASDCFSIVGYDQRKYQKFRIGNEA